MTRDPFDILLLERSRIADRVRRDVEQQLRAGGTATSVRDGIVIVEAADETGRIVTVDVRGTISDGVFVPDQAIPSPVGQVARG